MMTMELLHGGSVGGGVGGDDHSPAGNILEAINSMLPEARCSKAPTIASDPIPLLEVWQALSGNTGLPALENL